MAGPEWRPGYPDDYLPTIGINATGHDVTIYNILWPAGTVLVHPWTNEPVMIAFRSPADGNYAITGGLSMAQHPNCGNGIYYSLDRGYRPLSHGTLLPTATVTWSASVQLNKGQRIFLVISPRHSIGCDSTLVHLTVTPQS